VDQVLHLPTNLSGFVPKQQCLQQNAGVYTCLFCGMPTLAETVTFLSHYGDVLVLFALIPLISHLKFGGLGLPLSEAKDMAEQQSACEGDDQQSKESADSKTKKNIQAAASLRKQALQKLQDEVPPSWVMLLYLLAEVCASLPLLDPADKQVRKATFALARLQKKNGMQEILETVAKLLQNADVYRTIRFVAAFSSMGSIFISTALKLQDLNTASMYNTKNPIRLAYRMSGHLRKELAAPRSYLSIIVVVSCIAGNWTKVAKLIGRTAVWEILGAAAGPLRAIAAAGVVLRTRFSGPTPTWAALQCGASLVRMACVMMYERLTVPQLLEGGFVPKNQTVEIVRGTICMEACCVILLLPCVLSRRRLIFVLLCLQLPLLIVTMEGQISSALPHIDVVRGAEMLAICMGVVSFMQLFLGGFSSMLSCLVVIQVLARIHRLDQMRF